MRNLKSPRAKPCASPSQNSLVDQFLCGYLLFRNSKSMVNISLPIYFKKLESFVLRKINQVKIKYLTVPRSSHSVGVLQSYSMLSNISRGRKQGKVGPAPPPNFSSSFDVLSVTGISLYIDNILSFKKACHTAITLKKKSSQVVSGEGGRGGRGGGQGVICVPLGLSLLPLSLYGS